MTVSKPEVSFEFGAFKHHLTVTGKPTPQAVVLYSPGRNRLPPFLRMATRDDASFVATARDYFESFLLSFSAEPEATLASNMDEPPLPYIEQCNMMRETERTTLFVDFQHLTSYDSELADAVKEQFHLLEPHMRLSVGKIMAQLHEAFAQDKDFHVAVFNLPHLCCIRELRTDKIATLVSFTGTVTRTTDVRPELLRGVFMCKLCQAISDPCARASCIASPTSAHSNRLTCFALRSDCRVAQQFKYTQPVKCRNPACVNRSEWTLRHETSK